MSFSMNKSGKTILQTDKSSVRLKSLDLAGRNGSYGYGINSVLAVLAISVADYLSGGENQLLAGLLRLNDPNFQLLAQERVEIVYPVTRDMPREFHYRALHGPYE